MLAFDFGTRRIGVAVGNTLTRAAHPLTTIDATAARRPLRRDRGAGRANGGPGVLVVGLPMHADGSAARDDRARASDFARHAREAPPPAGGSRRRALHDARSRATSCASRRVVADARRPRDARRGGRAAHPAGWFDEAHARPTVTLPDAEAALAALVERMRGAVAFDAAFVGIYSGGAWIAERLAASIPGEHPVGFIDVSFYRDDFAPTGLKPDVEAHRAAVRRRGRDDRAGRRRALHRAQRPRRDQRAVRLRPSRARSSSRCWSTAAAASCRSSRPTSARGVAVARDLSIVLSRDPATAASRSATSRGRARGRPAMSSNPQLGSRTASSCTC